MQEAAVPFAPTGLPGGTPLPSPAPPPTFTGLRFTASPIDPALIQYMVALGAMGPPGHTLPTDHIYFYHQLDSPQPFRPIPLVAPASGTIVGLSSGTFPRVDVRVDSQFQYWIGPVELTGGFGIGSRVEAGMPIGSIVGGPAFDFAVLNLQQTLFFANPRRYGRDTVTSDGPIKYFDEPIRSILAAKVRRNGGDVEGRITYDVAGTLAGNWFAESLPESDSGLGGDLSIGMRKLSFARDVYDPDRQRVSIGGLGMTGLWGVPPEAPEFSTITPASGQVVYRLLNTGEPGGLPGTQQIGLLIVQLLDQQRLRIEAVPQTTGSSASFSSRAEIYLR